MAEGNDAKAEGGKEQSGEKKELTILLLGETGVGKSTFINALVNYLLFNKMDDAAENLICLIPTSFGIYDGNQDGMKMVTFGGPDINEAPDKTQSSTQSCRCYNFELDDTVLRIIDTPGIGDSRGVDRDAKNLKNLLSFLSNYKELNAICILLKPNNAKVSVVFKYCILELLTHLNKSACQNILFLFTNTRGTFYMPGDTAAALESLLEKVSSTPPHVNIKFKHENYFCFDSESFRYLVAISEPNYVRFNGNHKTAFEESWKRSVDESQRLFEYIQSLEPHSIQDTVSINDVRTKIINMRKPIAIITETIASEITACENHEKKIREFDGDMKELEKELFTPAMDIISVPLDKPITVCSDPACSEKNSIGNTSQVHYKTICHKPCYLDNSDGSIIGNEGLLDCQSFNKYEEIGEHYWCDPKLLVPDQHYELNDKGQVWASPVKRTKLETCVKCSHSHLVHLTINYETRVESKQVRDENKYERITTNEQAIKLKRDQINSIQKKVKELKQELKFITECSAHFARFLMNNAITAFNDALEEYITYAIVNEKKGNADAKVIESYNNLLESYKREKEIIKKCSEESSGRTDLTVEDINTKIKELFLLKYYGEVIKRHMDLEKDGRKETHEMIKEKKISLRGKNLNLFNKFKFWKAG